MIMKQENTKNYVKYMYSNMKTPGRKRAKLIIVLVVAVYTLL